MPAAYSRALASCALSALTALSLSSASLAAENSWQRSSASGDHRKAASTGCAYINANFSTPTTATSSTTNGTYDTFFPGEVITLTVAQGSSTGSSVSIVYDSDPAAVLAGPIIGASGSIVYTIPTTPPAGVGYYVNSVTPTDTNILVSLRCTEAPTRSVPVWGLVAGLLSALSLGALAAARLRRRNTV